MQDKSLRENLTVDEFCARVGISSTFYYRLRKQGRAPKELRLGARVLITPQARSAWELEQQNLSGKAAELQRRADEGLMRKSLGSAKHGGRPPVKRRAAR